MDAKLLQERLDQFNPEPLFEYDETLTKENIEKYVIVEDEDNIDLAKTNFLDVLNNEEIKKSSENIIRKYGVGTCGPRAFYGTTDVHLELEHRIAEFLHMEEAIVYSYGFITISSSIAAYCKKNDIVFIDKEANFAIHQGLAVSKSTVICFDHNDPNSFRREAEKIAESEKNKRQARKFLIVEGVSWKTGKVLPLVDFVKIAEDFKMRIFLEETYSVGIFGDHGRGLTEHFNVDPSRIDMIIGTLESAIGSVGGYCAGSQMVIEHQRLAGSGYMFSASLPTYLVQACLEAIRLMGDKPKKLRMLATEFQDFLKKDCKFNVISDRDSPFKVFTVFVEDETLRKAKEKEIHAFCKENGVHFKLNENGLVINLNVALYNNRPRLEKVCTTLRRASNL